MISVIFPVKNEEGNVEELHRRTKSALDDIHEPYEIIFVDDGSTDGTIKKLHTLSPITIIEFARNYGQSSALDAGIHMAQGDIVVIMDGDLQTDPLDIAPMFLKLREGYDAVVGWRKDRKDSLGRWLFSRFANFLARRILGVYFHDYACPIKIFRKEYMKGARLYGEMHVFLGAILVLRGARVAEIPVRHYERMHGISKHTFIKGAKDVADLLTIKFLMSTSRPLVFFGGFGLASFGIGFLAALWALILKLMGLRNFAQTPLPVVVSLFFVLGVLLIMLGFLSEIMLRSYYEGRRDTHYIIRKVFEKK
ncbi:MAG: hypothetical protein A3A16_02720 [Candidatus Harrisonbacteria bacterium RIFCSPLOWO2_01_FULL_44_18]|uniref:Glycosyltransferase 2-like domain-containing protein n=1 Tax=Candidatus Harrisonbacteria bacterium RIFCSPLOWO2_01_FULL_44_18 TaxID=1798407 RepID=A0A1G1ZMI4_9BACT|nr:MAG: hypothetical protein A3A16_02720 [Candidatus Harrisonbacteria bacterium RIFCSPLOWO2_01_FULL_44_18]